MSYSQLIFQFKAYLRYLKKAQGPHGVHSPFVYDLITHVLPRNIDFYCFEAIERARAELLKDSSILNVRDYGAGSTKYASPFRSVRSISKSAVKSSLMAQLIFRLVQKQKPKLVLELGTSLGITTCYLAQAVNQGRVLTIEGSPEIANVARKVWSDGNIENIELVVGNFDEVLEYQTRHLDQIDVVFIDGNHRREATKHYFEMLVAKVPDSGVMIFDDIHWSEGMNDAWDQIRYHPRVTISLDFFDFGVVYFNPDLPRQHFVLKVP